METVLLVGAICIGLIMIGGCILAACALSSLITMELNEEEKWRQDGTGCVPEEDYRSDSDW